jgi:hypothetical protein
VLGLIWHSFAIGERAHLSTLQTLQAINRGYQQAARLGNRADLKAIKRLHLLKIVCITNCFI